jgi:integrase
MGHNHDWKTQLQHIINRNNARHGDLGKGVAHKTMHERAHTLFLCFRQLRALGYQPEPRSLCNRHVRALVDYWVGKRELVKPSKSDQERDSVRPLSASTLQTRLSILRVFADWIGKTGMVLAPQHYVDDPALVERTYVAERDKSWTGNGVDIEAVIDQVTAYDPHVGMQLTFCHEFGLRVKEAIMLRPRESDVGELTLPHIRPDTCRYLKVRHGTKGGRVRFVPIDTPAKVDLVARAKSFVRFDANPLGNQQLELPQAMRRFYYVMDKFGVTMRGLNVTAHGLRHGYAQTNYELFAAESTPPPDPDVGKRATVDATEEADARRRVAELLGHSRAQITGVYLGNQRTPLQPVSVSPREGKSS